LYEHFWPVLEWVTLSLFISLVDRVILPARGSLVGQLSRDLRKRHPDEESGAVPDEVREPALVLDAGGEAADDEVQRGERSERENRRETAVGSSPLAEAAHRDGAVPAGVADDVSEQMACVRVDERSLLELVNHLDDSF
jgi:hypothetical protein